MYNNATQREFWPKAGDSSRENEEGITHTTENPPKTQATSVPRNDIKAIINTMPSRQIAVAYMVSAA